MGLLGDIQHSLTVYVFLGMQQYRLLGAASSCKLLVEYRGTIRVHMERSLMPEHVDVTIANVSAVQCEQSILCVQFFV